MSLELLYGTYGVLFVLKVYFYSSLIRTVILKVTGIVMYQQSLCHFKDHTDYRVVEFPVKKIRQCVASVLKYNNKLVYVLEIHTKYTGLSIVLKHITNIFNYNRVSSYFSRLKHWHRACIARNILGSSPVCLPFLTLVISSDQFYVIPSIGYSQRQLTRGCGLNNKQCWPPKYNGYNFLTP